MLEVKQSKTPISCLLTYSAFNFALLVRHMTKMVEECRLDTTLLLYTKTNGQFHDVLRARCTCDYLRRINRQARAANTVKEV